MKKIAKLFVFFVFVLTFIYILFIVFLDNNFLFDFKNINLQDEYFNDSNLSRSGIIKETNKERLKLGIVALSENNTLNKVAEEKVNDMIDNQYFEHRSPDGVEVGGLATRVGYKYIAVGENLAMGNFSDDKTIVNGWMESPDHKENILNPGYLEIGVAAKNGFYHGNETWLAVQVFGLPEWACPGVDKNIILKVEQGNETLSLLKSEIDSLKKEIDNSYNPDKKKINEYNNLVNNYNNLYNSIKSLTESYNEMVRLSNQCFEAYGF
jgi:FtsZ-binding cell division protein ZapB